MHKQKLLAKKYVKPTGPIFLFNKNTRNSKKTFEIQYGLQNETELCTQKHQKQLENHEKFIKSKQSEQQRKEQIRIAQAQQFTPEYIEKQKQLYAENLLKREAEEQKRKEQLLEKERIRQEQIRKQIEEKQRIEREQRMAQRTPEDIKRAFEFMESAPPSLSECNDEQKKHFDSIIQIIMDSVLSRKESEDDA